MKPRDWLTIVVIPLAVALGGWWISTAIQESQNRVKYIELAINVLQTPPSSDTPNLRVWAIEVMDNYSEVPLSDELKRELRTKRIPVSDTPSLGESLGTKIIPSK